MCEMPSGVQHSSPKWVEHPVGVSHDALQRWTWNVRGSGQQGRRQVESPGQGAVCAGEGSGWLAVSDRGQWGRLWAAVLVTKAEGGRGERPRPAEHWPRAAVTGAWPSCVGSCWAELMGSTYLCLRESLDTPSRCKPASLNTGRGSLMGTSHGSGNVVSASD